MGDELMRKYQIIYADPPWRQSKGGKKSVRKKSSGEPLPYSVMSLDDIKSHINQFSLFGEDNHNFFLWAIDKYLIEAHEIMHSLGYKLHARMIWNKVTGIPAAFTIRYGHEYLLWFYKEKLLPVARDQRGKIHSVFTEQVKKHSQKPEIAYRIIELLYPETNKIEFYARQQRLGWDVWGNEVESDIDLIGGMS